MKETEILGFDPTQLSVYLNEDTKDLDNTYEGDDFYDDYELEMEFKEMCEKANQNHINNCLKNKTMYVGYPRYIYLAGKISKYDWREPIVGYRCGGLYGSDRVNLTNYTVRYNRDTVITGPWFLSCDHGCYHGDNTHGLGLNQFGCPDAEDIHYSEKEVHDICLQQIEHSDIIFAYIYDNTCYGTIYEISYAFSCGKYVVIIFDNEKLMSDMWFMCQGAHIVEVLDKDTNIKEKFDTILKTISHR